MKLHQELAARQIQTLKLTPQLQQAVKILQASRQELEEMVEQEALENPVLDWQKSAGEGSDIPETEEKSEDPQKEDLVEYVQDFERYVGEDQDSWSSVSLEEQEGGFEEWFSRPPSLQETLQQQYDLSCDRELLKKIGVYLIASLDSRGYLRESLERIASALMVDMEDVKEALALLQSLEPLGIGARDLKECLQIQLWAQKKDLPLVEAILESHLEDLAANRYREISKATGADFDQIEKAVAYIRSLNPRPASGFLLESAQPESITPDIFLEFKDDEPVITLNDHLLPNLFINPWYRERIQNAEGMTKEELGWLKQKLDSAMWFRQCIEKRNETILLIADAIFNIQADFFHAGVKGLKPLTLADIASRVERHEATVSRVVNGKYALTPSGIFELKFFFSGGLKSDDGEMVSSRHIREILQKAIEEEDARRPISDQALSQLLKAQGIDIARRTVTKYREMMGIPSSSRRKKYV